MFALRGLLLGLGLALLALSGAAQEADPFDLLFGEETVDASADGQAGQDDLNLVSVRLGDLELTDAIAAYETAGGMCLPVADIVAELELAITVDGDVAAGWMLSEDRTVALDFLMENAVLGGQVITLPDTPFEQTADGWCATLPALSAILPIAFEYDARMLTVRGEAREILPVEARLEREAYRKTIRTGAATGLPDFGLVETPYRWLALPSFDLGASIAAGPSGTEQRISVEVAGDVLKTTGRLRTVSSEAAMIDGVRLTLSRENEFGEELGPLKARRFALGDVAAPALPLISDGQTGRGLIVSNQPKQRSDTFDTIDIRGPLPARWEAELYEGDSLVAFVTEPDANGDYVFEAVSLRPGYNRFTVKRFGPYGESDTRDLKYFVGADMAPENEVYYSFGLVQDGTALFGDRLRGERESEEAASNLPAAYASFEAGLSKRASLRVDALLSDDEAYQSAAAVSLYVAPGETYGVLRVASDGRGMPAIEARAQRRLGARSSLSAGVIDFGDVVTSLSGEGLSRLQRQADFRFDTSVQMRQKSVPVRTRMLWKQSEDGRHDLSLGLQASTSAYQTRWSSTVALNRQWDADRVTEQVTGEIIASRRIQDVRTRASLAWGADDAGLSLRSLNVSAQKRFERGQTGALSLVHDLKGGVTQATASWAQPFRQFTLSGNAGLDTEGIWSVGVSLSFSLFADPQSGRYRLGEPGVTRSGTIRPYVFEDMDGNGAPSAGDIPISGAEFVVARSLIKTPTGNDGQVLLSGLPTGERVDIAVKRSSLDDPFLVPARQGALVTPRPGQVIDMPFAVTQTGDIEGTVMLSGKPGVRALPVSGVEVEAVNADGRVIARALTEYDGYFYFGDIPVGAIQVRVAKADLEAAEAESTPYEALLTRDAPSAYGIRLDVVQG